MTGIAALLDRTGRAAGAALLRPRAGPFVATLALAFLALAGATSLAVFGGIPHVQDSQAQYVHAKFLAAGALVAPAPDPHEFFWMPLMIQREGTWYSQFPPGHIALLAVGHLAGAPWLVNPVLGALALLAVYFLARETHGVAVARLSALLMLLCPFAVFMSSEYMNHASALLFSTLFALFFARALRRGGVGDGVAAGAALGMDFVTRPFTALAIAAPFAAFGLLALWREPRRRLRSFAPAGAVFLCFVGLQAAYNLRTNGDPLLYGYQVNYGENHRPGFVEIPESYTPVMYPPGRHTLRAGIEQTVENLVALNRYLFEWPISSLLFVALEFLGLPRNRWSWMFGAAFASLAGAYVFYFYQDICFGPRFLYEATGLLVILTASGMLRSAAWLGARAPRLLPRQAGCGAVAIAAAALYATSALVYLPERLALYGDAYWGVDPRLHAHLQERAGERALVLMTSHYGNVAFENPPSEQADVIYARSLRAADRLLMQRHPDRWVYREQSGALRRLRSPRGPLREAPRRE